MNVGRTLIGLVLVAVGTVFLLDAADVVDGVGILGDWWPAAVIGLGLLQVASEGRLSAPGVVLMVGGAVLLVATTGLLGEIRWRVVWPAVLIVAGLALVLGWGRRRTRPSTDEELIGIAVLAGSHYATASTAFRRASLTSVLGGLTLDLTEATPVPGGARISATAVMGGIDVVVPHGWRVEIRGLPLLGGWDDTTARDDVSVGSPRLEIHALLVMGGLEVKHPRRWD